ncbi:MAG: alpha/beta hydrolase domain-containing protein [Solirubrobacteraceae bacterium]
MKRAAVASTVAAAVFLAVGAAAASSAAALPTATEIAAGSGSHGYPYDAVPETPAVPGAPFINLSEVGYAQREFTMSGGATVYKQSGLWSSNGKWAVSPAQTNVPYTTRLLVRYPTDPAKFNGTVVFEWLNDTTGGDQDPVWAQLYSELIDKGYAYVGVTAQRPGMKDLASWDPTRYGALGDSNDGESYQIFTQAAEAVKSDSATLLGGLTPKELIATGDSQSAFRLDTYVNAIQPLTHAFNGFLVVGRAVTAAPIGEGLVASSPFPALIRTDNATPFIQLNTQGDIEELDAAAARQPDNNDLRTWEVTGAAHIDAHEASYETETLAREDPTVQAPSCVLGTPIEGTGTSLDGHNQPDNMPLFEVEDAAMAALQNWVTNGVQPAHGSQISTIPLFFGAYDLVNKNRYGVGEGGIRMPEAQVPAENYSALNFANVSEESLNPVSLLGELEGAFESLESGGITNEALRDQGLCLLSGYFTDFSQSTLKSLYPTTATYASKFTTAANAEVAAGFMTPEDAAAAIAAADAGTGPLQQPPLAIP